MNGQGRFPLRVGHYAEVGAAVHPCGAPFSPRVRLRSTEAPLGAAFRRSATDLLERALALGAST